MNAQPDASRHCDKPRLLIPRPARQAEAFAAQVEQAMPGRWDCVTAPLIEIRFRPGILPLDGIDRLLFTSANGVDAFAAASQRRDLPAICVGESTARAAQAIGLEARIAGPDAQGMLHTLTAEPSGPRSLLVRGAHAAADIAGQLRSQGHPTVEAVLYDQVARPLPDDIRRDLMGGFFGGITLFSPRTARLLREALDGQTVPPECLVFCLSAAVAAAASGGLGGHLMVADTPSASGMLALMRVAEAR